MSKPEEIPQDVMKQAHMVWQNANTDGSVFTADGQGSKYIPVIALAILAAKSEERENIAQLVEDYEADLRSWDGPTERAIARASTDYACIDIAEDIRKRGEPL